MQSFVKLYLKKKNFNLSNETVSNVVVLGNFIDFKYRKCLILCGFKEKILQKKKKQTILVYSKLFQIVVVNFF